MFNPALTRFALVLCLATLPATGFAQTPKPDAAEIKARKAEELAKEKAAIRTPNDPLKAMAVQEEARAKRAMCRKQASAQGLHFAKRREFMKTCENG